MELKNLSKYWGLVSYLVCGLLIIVPISYSFHVEGDNPVGYWKKQTVYNTFVYTVGVGSWILLWLLLPKVKNKTIRRIGSIVMLLIYGLSVFVIAYSLSIVSPDFSVGIGAELILLACPVILIDTAVLWKGAEKSA